MGINMNEQVRRYKYLVFSQSSASNCLVIQKKNPSSLDTHVEAKLDSKGDDLCLLALSSYGLRYLALLLAVSRRSTSVNFSLYSGTLSPVPNCVELQVDEVGGCVIAAPRSKTRGSRQQIAKGPGPRGHHLTEL